LFVLRTGVPCVGYKTNKKIIQLAVGSYCDAVIMKSAFRKYARNCSKGKVALCLTN
jgi:hypothetical protein